MRGRAMALAASTHSGGTKAPEATTHDRGASAPAPANPVWAGLALAGGSGGITIASPTDPAEHDARRASESARATTAFPRAVAGGRPRGTTRPSSPSPFTSDAGAPLDADVRDRTEAVLDVSLAGVTVHADDRSRHAAAAINARAFTVGQHIHLGPGARGSDLGLMAHEAAHTTQAAQPGVVYRDVTDSTISAGYASALDDGTLQYDIQLVQAALQTTPAADPMHGALAGNLTTLQEEASHRHPGASCEPEPPLLYSPPPPPSVAQIPEGGTNVGRIGVVGWDGQPALRLRTSPDTDSTSNIITTLPFSTRLQVIKSFPGDWYFVSTPTGDMGYTASQYVRTDLPEPNARLHRVAPGIPGTAIAIAERYYGEYADDWGQDLRFYVNVLAWANNVSVPDHYWGWRGVHFQAGQLIWVPSQRFAYSLRGQINSGSISYEALDTIGLAHFIERVAELWDDFNAALDYSDEYKADAMARRIEESAVGLIEGLISMIKMAVAILAITTAVGAILGGVFGVGAGAAPGAAAGFEVGMVIIEWLGLGMLVMWIGQSLIQLGEAFGHFLGTVWDAHGDERQLRLAGWEWADAIALMLAKILEGLLMLVMARGMPEGIEALRGTRLGRAMGETRAMEWLRERSARVESGEAPLPTPGAVFERVMGTGRPGASPANVTQRGNVAEFHSLPPGRLPANLPEGHFWMRSADGTEWVLMREGGADPIPFELSVYSDGTGTNYVLRAGGRLIQSEAITRTDSGYSGGARLPPELSGTGADNPYLDPVTGQPWDKGHGVDYVDTREGPGVRNSTQDPANFTPQASWWNQGPRNALVSRIREGHAASGRAGGGGYREMGIYDPSPPVTADGTPIPREFVFVETDAAGTPQHAWRIPNQQGAAGRGLSAIDSMEIPVTDAPQVMLGPDSPLAGAGGGSTTYAPGIVFGMRGDRETHSAADMPVPAMCVDTAQSAGEPVCQ